MKSTMAHVRISKQRGLTFWYSCSYSSAISHSSVTPLKQHNKLLQLACRNENGFLYTGMFLLGKATISSGMKPPIFVFYRQASATLVLAPLAYFLERKVSTSLKWLLLLKIFIVSSCGMALSLNLHFISLKYVTATFATASTNAIPAMVFIIAVALRIETLDIKKFQGQAKVLGTVVCLSGAMVYALYRGPALYSGTRNEGTKHTSNSPTMEEWLKGSIFLLASGVSWSAWLVMQSPLLREYPAKLRLTTMQIGFSCIPTAIYCAILERDTISWELSWNFNLLSIAYCGIVVTAVSYPLMIWVVDRKGPIFSSVFSPLTLLLTAICCAVLFHEAFYLGSLLGGVLLISGLYAFYGVKLTRSGSRMG